MRQFALFLLAAAVLIGLAGPSHSATAWTGEIGGCLTSKDSGQPLRGAWVVVAENNLGATTDSTGCFLIPDLPPGQYHLIIEHSTLGTVRGLAELEIEVVAGQNATVNIAVARSITGKREAEKKVGIPAPVPTDLTSEPVVRVRSKPGRPDNSGKRELNDLRMLAAGGAQAEVVAGVQKTRRGTSYSPPGLNRLSVGMPRPGDMFFRDYGTSGAVATASDRFSTFAVDVDDAAYPLIKRYLEQGQLPPPAAIRAEEVINHFDYGYKPPDAEKFRIFTEITESPFETGKHFLKVALKGREIDRRDRRPVNLTLVIDVSGSMARGNRLELVKESIRTIVRQLDGNDRVGIVAYGSQAYVLLQPTEANRADEILRACQQLTPGGSTYAEGGLRQGYVMADRQYVNGHNNIIMLCSDGVANVGRTSPDDIMREVARNAEKGISLSTLGVGMGNYNDFLMEQLAQKGNGQYAYINGRGDVERVLSGQFVSNFEALARDVKIQVEFDPNAVQAYRLIGYENRDVPDHRFRDNSQDGGEVGSGHEITALYELTLKNRRPRGRIGAVSVRWANTDRSEVSETSREIIFDRQCRTFDGSRPELRLAIVAARFGEKLKQTEYGSKVSYGTLARLADAVAHDLPGEQCLELLRLIQTASRLSDLPMTWRLEESDGENYIRR